MHDGNNRQAGQNRMDRIYRQPGKCAFTGDICAAGMNRGIGRPLVLQVTHDHLYTKNLSYHAEKVEDRCAWGVASHHSPWD